VGTGLLQPPQNLQAALVGQGAQNQINFHIDN
jgi:hypothetical protein